MNQMVVMIRKDINEMMHNRAVFMMLAVAVFIIYMISNSIGSGIDTLAEQGGDIYDTAQSLAGTLFLMLMFIIMLLVSLYMNAYTVLMEKTKRTLESLLCTPINLKSLWLGKTLATFIPALVLGLLLGAGTLVFLNVTTLEDEVGRWVIPGAAALVGTIIVLPVIVFLLSSLVVMLQLMLQNVRLIQTIFTALLFGSSFGLSYTFRFSSGTWTMVWIELGIAAVLGAVAWFLSTKLTKERIVLTSKGQ